MDLTGGLCRKDLQRVHNRILCAYTVSPSVVVMIMSPSLSLISDSSVGIVMDACGSLSTD